MLRVSEPFIGVAQIVELDTPGRHPVDPSQALTSPTDSLMLGHRGHKKRRIDNGCEMGSGEDTLGLAVTSEQRAASREKEEGRREKGEGRSHRWQFGIDK